MKKTVLFLFVAFGLSSVAQINQLVNLSTGTTNPSNASLSAVGSYDDTWTVTPPGGSSQSAIVSNGTLWSGSILYTPGYPSNSCGQWISPYTITTPGVTFGAIPSGGSPSGDFIYSMSFTSTALPNQLISNAQIFLNYAGGDNTITAISVNGHSHALSISFTPLTSNVIINIPNQEINLVGTNTITVNVNNQSAYTGLFLCGNLSINYKTCPTDVTGDGVVNVADLSLFLATYGKICP